MKKKLLFEKFYEIAIKNFENDSKLAKALGMTRGSFGKYTRKHNPRSPKLSTLESWCDKLNIEIKEEIFINK